MRLKEPLLRLPVRFSPDALAGEVAALPDSAWIPHPNRIPGNAAVPLVTPHGQITDAVAGPMSPTPHLRASRYMMEVMAELGAVWGRSRLMRLAPGATVPAHIDINYYWRTHIRIHVPIVTTPEVLFTCDGETVHKQAGECWIFDTWRSHNVVNGGSMARVHMVLDTVGGERLWELIEAARGEGGRTNPEAGSRQPNGADVDRLLFEQVNAPRIMSPWELRSHIAFIADEAEPHPLLASVVKRLEKLAFGWSAAWAVHGPSESGLADYRRLLERAQRDLDVIGGSKLLLKNGISLYRELALLIFGIAAPLPQQRA